MTIYFTYISSYWTKRYFKIFDFSYLFEHFKCLNLLKNVDNIFSRHMKLKIKYKYYNFLTMLQKKN